MFASEAPTPPGVSPAKVEPDAAALQGKAEPDTAVAAPKPKVKSVSYSSAFSASATRWASSITSLG